MSGVSIYIICHRDEFVVYELYVYKQIWMKQGVEVYQEGQSHCVHCTVNIRNIIVLELKNIIIFIPVSAYPYKSEVGIHPKVNFPRIC